MLCFAHGTELKMFNNERRGDEPAEFPLRFLPFMQREKIFDYADPEHGVDVAAAISIEQVDALLDVFPEFPRERVVLSPNGYNQDVFLPMPDGTDRAAVLAGFSPSRSRAATASPNRSRRPEGFDAVVAFCGKFADWKRLDALLRAAAIYEQDERRIMTAGDRLRAGRGPARDAQAEPPNSGCAAPTSSAPGHRTSSRCCSAAPTSAASRPTANRSASCSSSAWPAALR